ncbi:MAG: hypothetical protein JO250_00095 [Armatimonadetes bacterium]|nr:hypothetical protein [Armatimonadota bacterium]
MRYSARLLSLGAALMALATVPAAARPPVPVPHPAPGHRLQFDPRKFMRVGELRPGMRGYALTVFQGTKIDRFGIEILGVIKKFNEGRDYILFRATDGPPVTRHLNIAHGMSGSPIYVKGKLVGAISMEVSNGTRGPSFPREPIGLATPIEEMFDAWSPDLPSKPTSISAGPSGGGAGASGYAALSFQPIDLPVAVSGMNGAGLARLNAAFAPYHLTLMAGGGGAGAPAKNPIKAGAPLRPGAAVGVSLMQGDMDFTATGTVTYRDGNRLLLFGHPFFGLGPVDAAMTTASVVGIYPSFEDSVKLGQPLQTVGRIFQDRPFSVGGVIGSLPQMIPMTVSVNDLSIKRRKDFHVRIINHPLLTAQLVTSAADQAIEEVHGMPGDSMATVTMDVNVEEIGHVRRTNTFYDAVSIDQAAIGDLDSLLRLLSSNPFYPLSVKSIKMGVTIQTRHDTAEVDHIFLKQSKFAPGDDVSVGVVLKPYKRERVTRYVTVKIPANTPDGTLSLSVQGGGEGGGGGISIGGFILLTSPAPTGPADTVAQLVKQFVEKPRNNELVARLTLPTSAIDIAGEKLSNLPPTLASVMRATRSTGLRTERDEVKVVQTTPYIVSGTESLSITVQKKDATETPKPASPGSPAPPPSSGGSTSSSDDSSGAPAEVSTDDSVDALPVAAKSQRLAPAAPGPTATNSVRTGQAGASSPAPPEAGAAGASTSTAPTAPVKTVGRLPTVWRQDSMADFAAGTLKNVSVTSTGDVRLSAALQKLADTPETYVWSILPDGKGSVYVGTGDRGILYKMTADGKMSPFFKTGQLEVTALATDGSGNLYVGTAPHGIVYRVGSDGKGGRFLTTQEKYVTALAAAGGSVYAATGGGTGRVYRLPAQSTAAGSPPPLFTSPEAHILSLATDKAGNVYAGSSPDGIVYKITPQGKSSVFYSTSDPNISALATDSQGSVYAGTTPKGDIFKIAPDGTAKLLSDRATSGVLSLRTDAGDSLYACAGSTIYRIAPDETVQSFTADDEQFLTLAVDGSGGQVYAGTGTVGSVYSLGNGGTGRLRGTFQSVVHDAALPSRWGTLAWTADTPPGTHVALQTRSGDVPTPDASWSAWSPVYDRAGGETITSPPARYLQYQAVLTRDAGAAPDAAPKLRDVTVYYLTRNQPPTVRFVSPAGGTALHKAALLQWTASDPDNDTLTYDLSWSADGGRTWTPLKKRATPQGPNAVPQAPPAATKTASAGPVTEQEVQAKVAQMETTLDRQHPGLPPAIRAQLVAQGTDAIRRSLQSQRAAPPSTPSAGGAAVKETSFSWDTTEVPDGTYQVQVVASDRPSNPQGWLTAKAVSSPFLVANTPPTLLLGADSVNADKTVTVHGVAQTKLAFVKAVQGRADGGDFVAALADDGLFDSPLEAFTLTLGPLSSGAHTIEVQAVDQAGNAATATRKVTVP